MGAKAGRSERTKHLENKVTKQEIDHTGSCLVFFLMQLSFFFRIWGDSFLGAVCVHKATQGFPWNPRKG